MANIPFAFTTETVNLFDKNADIEPLIELAKRFAASTGLPLGSIIIDTLHSVLAGGDENSGQDMGAVMFHGSRLKDETGATPLWIHHLGKDQSKGARGHSSLMGKVDTAMEMDDHGILTVKKQRDGKRGEQFGFQLVEVVLGQDSGGRDVTSCVVAPVNVAANNAFGIAAVKPGSINSKALIVLQDMTMNGDGTLVSAWKSDFVTKHYPGKRKSGGTAFDRAREALFQSGNITMEGDYATPAE